METAVETEQWAGCSKVSENFIANRANNKKQSSPENNRPFGLLPCYEIIVVYNGWPMEETHHPKPIFALTGVLSQKVAAVAVAATRHIH